VIILEQRAGAEPILLTTSRGAHGVILFADGVANVTERELRGPTFYDRRVEPGDLLVGNNWRVGVTHAVRWDAPHQAIAMFVESETVEAACRTLGLDYSATAFDDRYLVRDPLLEQLARALGRELAEGFVRGPLYAEQLLLTAAVQLVRGYSPTRLPRLTPHRGGLPGAAVRRVESLVRARLDEDLRLADLAGAAGLSEYHFCRAFRQATGMAPFEFVVRIRVEEAKRRLRDTDRGVLDIAVDVGYHSASHFSRLFRRQVGLTPTAYRRARS
jgi:AraC family transcriptional regulator